MDSSIKNLASNSPKRKELTFLAYFQGQKTIDLSEHLSCFSGSNFMLGGQVLGRNDISMFGEKLISSCRQTYRNTKTGIGPEVFGWDPRTIPEGLNQFYNDHGWYQLNGIYVLRPELLESYYSAWQITKNPKYRDWAWEAFQSITKVCKVGSGFSGINDVSKANGGGFTDSQESFFLSETLKYAYLTLHPVSFKTFGLFQREIELTTMCSKHLGTTPTKARIVGSSIPRATRSRLRAGHNQISIDV